MSHRVSLGHMCSPFDENPVKFSTLYILHIHFCAKLGEFRSHSHILYVIRTPYLNRLILVFFVLIYICQSPSCIDITYWSLFVSGWFLIPFCLFTIINIHIKLYSVRSSSLRFVLYSPPCIYYMQILRLSLVDFQLHIKIWFETWLYNTL